MKEEAMHDSIVTAKLEINPREKWYEVPSVSLRCQECGLLGSQRWGALECALRPRKVAREVRHSLVHHVLWEKYVETLQSNEEDDGH